MSHKQGTGEMDPNSIAGRPFESNSELLKANLQNLRSGFAAGSVRYIRTKCCLCRESYTNGTLPVLIAASPSPPTFEGMRLIIGDSVDGLNSFNSGMISSSDTFYHWWFVHQQLKDAKSIAKYSPDSGPLIYEASRVATECESLFAELAEEAGRLLQNFPKVSHRQLSELLETKDIRYGRLLWIVSIFTLAMYPPPGTSLRTSRTVPPLPDIDICAATGGDPVPESVVVNLESNAFLASMVLIDLLSSSIVGPSEDGPCGAFQWRHKGKLLPETMAPAPWKMVNFLWDLKHREASFDDLKEPVYSDREHIADEKAFGSHRRLANRFFEEHEIPLRVSIKKSRVLLNELESDPRAS